MFEQDKKMTAVTVESSLGSSGNEKLPQVRAGIGGQPYDGKPYYNSDLPCTDGSVISSRILVTNGQPYMVRDKCKDMVPTPLPIDEINIGSSNGSILSYSGVTYQHELGPIQIPLLSTFFTQLTGVLNFNMGTQVYVVDLFETSSADIEKLKSQGYNVICNFSAGSWEQSRPDQNEFPKESIGNTNGSPSERYLDVASPAVRSIMLRRLDLAHAKGCLGVDFDNMDGYANDTGFQISTESQIEFNSILAYAAHDRKLFAGFHNAPEIVSSLVNSFDFAYVEECFKYSECQKYSLFIENNKPTFVTEYTSYDGQLCSMAESLGLSLAFQSKNLDGSIYRNCK
jgi:hypothetical protein